MGWTRRDFAATFQRMLRKRYEAVGAEVRRLRENLGYSQEDLAHKAGVSTKTVSRIETPGDEPHETRPGTYRKIAEALGVTVEHLRGPLLRNAEIHEPDLPSASETLERGLAEAGQDHRQASEASERRQGEQDRPKPEAGAGGA